LSLISLFLLLTSQYLCAGESVYVSLGGFGENSGHRSGAEIAGLVFNDDYLGARMSGVAYDSNPEKDLTDLFTGYSVMGFVHLNTAFSPYLGMGLFLGENEECIRDTRHVKGSGGDDDEDYICIYRYAVAVYPEAGLSLRLGTVHIAPYVRRFFDSENSFDAFTTYGLNVSFLIR
jgi:hypothetical protein